MNVQDFLISEDATILNAMAQLDRVAKKVLFVEVDDRLRAALTDGDIRRWLLKKGSLDATVREVANYNPKFILESDKNTARTYMKEFSIEALPVLTDEGKLVSVTLWNDEVTKRKVLDVPIVVMAGGFGTRLYPYTRVLPKPLIPIGDLPIAEHIVNRFFDLGSTLFYFVVNHKKNMIKAYFNEIERDYKIEFADEDEPLGTGGGLSLLKGKVQSTFVLTNCDILIEEDYEKIYQFHKSEGNLITMVCSLKNVKIPYGVIEIGAHGEVAAMKEKPEFSFFTNTGMYIVESRVIDELEEGVSIGFPDIIEKYKEQGEKIGVFPISEHAWLDMGQLDELEKMRRRIEGK